MVHCVREASALLASTNQMPLQTFASTIKNWATWTHNLGPNEHRAVRRHCKLYVHVGSAGLAPAAAGSIIQKRGPSLGLDPGPCRAPSAAGHSRPPARGARSDSDSTPVVARPLGLVSPGPIGQTHTQPRALVAPPPRVHAAAASSLVRSLADWRTSAACPPSGSFREQGRRPAVSRAAEAGEDVRTTTERQQGTG